MDDGLNRDFYLIGSPYPPPPFFVGHNHALSFVYRVHVQWSHPHFDVANKDVSRAEDSPFKDYLYFRWLNLPDDLHVFSIQMVKSNQDALKYLDGGI
jgi:hypothetical protein